MTPSHLNRSSVGRNIERLRKIKNMKQEALASELGITRQSLSKIEQSDEVDEQKLEQIAKALGVSKETLLNFDEEAVIINIENMNDHSGVYQYFPNPVEKIVELYEALLKSEREKIDMLTKLLEKKNAS